MKEFRDKHYMIKVGNMYVEGYSRENVSFVSEVFKRKASKFEEELVIDVIQRLEGMGLKPSLLRVDSVTTITETEIATLEIINDVRA